VKQIEKTGRKAAALALDVSGSKFFDGLSKNSKKSCKQSGSAMTSTSW